ncbi:MAG: hypothetical protein DVB28_000817 [Verrucomicrobia bacterium]|nr:MAG: hypothetical protein DVB28_000817 [Verrucomicrobiota bacterium]
MGSTERLTTQNPRKADAQCQNPAWAREKDSNLHHCPSRSFCRLRMQTPSQGASNQATAGGAGRAGRAGRRPGLECVHVARIWTKAASRHRVPSSQVTGVLGWGAFSV